MAHAFYIDFGALDMALEPIVREVMAAAKPGSAGRDKAAAEQTAEETMVNGMLWGTVERVMTRVVLDDLEGATVGWDRSDGKQRLACVRKLGYTLSDDNVLGGGQDNVFRATAGDGSVYAIKVFRLHTSYKPFGSLREEYDRTVRMSKLASDIGVGPKFHKAFTCQAAFGGTYGVLVMDNVEGKVLREWLRPKLGEAKPTAAQKAKVRKNVEAAIEKMHGQKLFHNGLYRGNVLVTPSLTPLFLGYSGAKDDPKENSWSDATPDGRHRDFDILRDFDDDDTNRWEDVETAELVRQVIAKAIERNIVGAVGATTFSQERRTGASPARDLPQKLDQNSPAPQAQAGGKGAKATPAKRSAKAKPASAKAKPAAAKAKPAAAKPASAKAKAKPAPAKRAA